MARNDDNDGTLYEILKDLIKSVIFKGEVYQSYPGIVGRAGQREAVWGLDLEEQRERHNLAVSLPASSAGVACGLPAGACCSGRLK